jgi:hypothetical protein
MSTQRTTRSPTAPAPDPVRAVLLAILLAACGTAPQVTQPTPLPTREPNTLSVSVLLDLSGSRAPSGQPQRSAMQLWLDQQRAPQAVTVKAKFVDVASSDARVLLELRRAVVEDHADAVVIGVPITLDDAFSRAVQVAGVPVLLTLPAPEPAATVGGRWTFVLAPTPDVLARALVSNMLDGALLTPMLLASDDTASALIERGAFLAELARRQLMQPTAVILTQTDGPARWRAASAVAKSVVLAAAPAHYGDLIRAIPATADAPRVYLSYLTETADVASLRDQTAIVTWPGTRRIATLPNGISTIAGTAYDALGILQTAAALAPSELDASRLRLRLETLTFGGVVTTYRFAFTRHAGFSTDDLAFLRWNAPRGAPFIAPSPTETAR